MAKFGTRHRCVTKITGEKPLTQLQKDKIARGELSPADLAPKDKPQTQPLGRLAKRPADMGIPISQPRQPASRPCSASSQPSPADILAAIDRLTAAFEKLETQIAALHAH
jgi:hypothetical protein